MNLREIAVQLFLHSRESDNGYFLLRLIAAKQINKKFFTGETARLFDMTPQEQLFADFFNREKVLVKDMDTLSLEVHREELAKIAFEARARLTAVDDEKRSRKAPMKGFQASLHVDELASNAINKVRERGTRLSKEERLIDNMMKLPGMDRATAERLVSAGTVKAQLDTKFGESKSTDGADGVNKNLPFKLSNPFAAPAPVPDVQINEETNAVIIKEPEVIPTEETKTSTFSFVNPFAKN